MLMRSNRNVEIRYVNSNGYISSFQFLAVTCKALSNPQHGRLLNCDSQQDRDDEYGSICSFQCNEGYVMYGSSTLSCKTDGNWSSQAPRCEGK